MKTARILLLLLPGTAFADPADHYENFIRQIQVDSGLEWDVTVGPEGQCLSEEGVGPDGSNFELWSVHIDTANDYLLDEQYVSSFLPNAQIAITSADPYSLIPRTRVDQPFTVSILVSGLDDGTSGIPPDEIPEAAKKVGFLREGMVYPAGSHTGEGSGITPSVISEGFIETNGQTVLDYPITALSGPDLTELEGEEIFTVSSLASFGSDASVLDSKRIQIWPIASGSLSGLDPNTRYLELPPIGVTLHNLYPSSATYVRAYHGAPDPAPTESFMLLGSYVLVNDSVPQERSLTIDEIDEYFIKEGPYTLEIIHETPFGVDLLQQFYPLQVDRTIEMKASLFSDE